MEINVYECIACDHFLCAPFIVVVGLWRYAVGRHGLGVVIVDAQWIV